VKYHLTQHTLAGARRENQDRIATMEGERAVLMVLADGLGGHAGGEQAASALVETFGRAFQKAARPVIAEPAVFLVLSVLAAHRRINARARRAEGSCGRTTCVACLVQEGRAHWVHVGDSRLYHVRDGALLSRTVDHTTVEQLRQDGILETRKGRKIHRQLMQCVGGPQRPRVAVGPQTPLATGDTLLMCSDGLWQAVPEAELVGQLARPDLEEAVEDLLITAERRMRRRCDNLSAVALRWEDAPGRLPDRPARGADEIDQDLLWLQLKGRAPAAAPAATPAAAAAPARNGGRDEIARRIEELERFVEGIDLDDRK